MSQLGISIYPSKSNVKEDKKYLTLASKYGYTRIFMSLLEITGDREEVVNKFKEIIQYGNSLGMETSIDINPSLFDQLEIQYEDLSFFKELGVSAIRLDLGFNGATEALMTKNEYGLKIEVNISSGTKSIDNVMTYQPKRENLIASHNFYPMRYSGLSREHFNQTTAQFNQYDLTTAAFITSQDGKIGPWPMHDGLCTLEEHRDLPIYLQALHHKILGTIDDLIIGNAYASEEELRTVSEIFFSPHHLIPVQLNPKRTDLENKILLNELHTYRGDRSAYLIRSTESRVKYKDEEFPPHQTGPLNKGTVSIGNNNFGQYKGETQIILQTIEDEGRRNVVGELPEEAVGLLDDLPPYSTFRFIEVD